ncbi:MAG: VWA domain-containing protein, partial [Leptospirillia bacterium]
QARAVRESRRAHAAGIEVYTVGHGWNLRSLASSRAHSFEWWFSNDTPAPQARAAAARALRVVDDTFYGLQPDTVTISDTLPVDIGYVPGSAGPGGTWDGAKRRVSWTIPQPGVVTHTRTFDIRPLACGHLALSEGGLAQAYIAGSVVASYAYPIPEADVPCPTATATTTPTPTATATSPATSTPTVNPTATRRPRPLYLPVALREPPCSAVRRTDVALVLDTSRSMLEATTGGRTKLEAAVAAAEAFLDLLALPEDQAAVVTFNGGVQVVASLTGDRAALSKAFGRIVPGSGTRIHLGIEAAVSELTGPARRGENVPVMVVLTDGRASPDGPEVAVAAADRAKAAGILIFTIGLGADLDRGALRQMASRPEWFYEAPDAEELAGVYSAVAVAIPCPPGTYWGRRE